MNRMMGPRNKYYLLNFVFVGCVAIMLLNDHWLKYSYPGWLTGKLSDGAGIILLPLLLSFLFPLLKCHSIWISAVLFAFWKSPYSQGLIDLYNTCSIIPTSRVVDYTDLWVLALLPVPDLMLKDRWDGIRIRRVSPLPILLVTMVTLMSTEPPPSFYYTRTKGNLYCHNCTITVNYSQDEIVEKLKKVNIMFDSVAPHLYRVNELIIDKDTLRQLDFGLRPLSHGKTKIYFAGMEVSADISSYKLEKKLRRYYKKMLFKELALTLHE